MSPGDSDLGERRYFLFLSSLQDQELLLCQKSNSCRQTGGWGDSDFSEVSHEASDREVGLT